MTDRNTLPISPPYPPMEATVSDEIPAGDAWQYEPKWDGFRCLAFRDGRRIELQSKAGQPLARYFPDVVERLAGLGARRFVLDSEIVIPVRGRLSFDDLLLRLHPAASRVAKLAQEHPAELVVFDLLVDEKGRALVREPLEARRRRLEDFAAAFFGARIHLSPATRDRAQAQRWLERGGASLDGVVAKRLDLDYRSGERTGMVKVKRRRTADCVVGGFRYASSGEKVVGSLLLGLYNDEGELDHVGFTSAIRASERKALTRRLRAHVGPPGFTGRAPGGPSRWTRGERSTEWEPLRPEIVVEVEYDHFSGGRFRHGTRLVRFRPDKAPRQCTFEQVRPPGRSLELQLLRKGARG